MSLALTNLLNFDLNLAFQVLVHLLVAFSNPTSINYCEFKKNHTASSSEFKPAVIFGRINTINNPKPVISSMGLLRIDMKLNPGRTYKFVFQVKYINQNCT